MRDTESHGQPDSGHARKGGAFLIARCLAASQKLDLVPSPDRTMTEGQRCVWALSREAAREDCFVAFASPKDCVRARCGVVVLPGNEPVDDCRQAPGVYSMGKR